MRVLNIQFLLRACVRPPRSLSCYVSCHVGMFQVVPGARVAPGNSYDVLRTCLLTSDVPTERKSTSMCCTSFLILVHVSLGLVNQLRGCHVAFSSHVFSQPLLICLVRICARDLATATFCVDMIDRSQKQQKHHVVFGGYMIPT